MVVGLGHTDTSGSADGLRMCSQVLGLTGSPGGDNSLVQLLLLHLHLLVICACHDCLSARTIPNAGPLHGHLRCLMWVHATIGDLTCCSQEQLVAIV